MLSGDRGQAGDAWEQSQARCLGASCHGLVTEGWVAARTLEADQDVERAALRAWVQQLWFQLSCVQLLSLTWLGSCPETPPPPP